MNYAYDPTSWTIEAAYLFGDEFIVTPTMDPGATSVEVYFPPLSGNWVHLVKPPPSPSDHFLTLSALLSGEEMLSTLPLQGNELQSQLGWDSLLSSIKKILSLGTLCDHISSTAVTPKDTPGNITTLMAMTITMRSTSQ
jgi:hypothetical protein